MFVSPCTLRSTQCAALIALAAAAGLARIETNTSPRASSSDVSPAPAPAASHSRPGECSSRTSFECLQPIFVLAVWWSCESEPVSACLGSLPARPDEGSSTPVATLPASTGARVPSASRARRFARTHRAALCRLSHALPFAVGPPRCRRLHPPTAEGTHVPGDSAATGTSGFKVAAPDEDSSLARLARGFFPGQPLAGPVFRFTAHVAAPSVLLPGPARANGVRRISGFRHFP